MKFAMKMIEKRFFRIYIPLVIVFSMMMASFSVSYAAVSARKTEDDNVISFGFQYQEGFQMVDEHGKRSGYCYDYLQKIRTYTGWNYEYIGENDGSTFADLLPKVMSGEIDLMGNVTYLEERAEFLEYSDFPMGTEYSTIYIKKGDKKYVSEDYEGWNGMRIGILEGTYYVQSMRDYAESRNITYEEHIYDSDEATVEALDRGEIDAFVAGSMHVFRDVAILEQFDPQLVYFATKKGNTALMDRLNKAMIRIESSDSGFTKELAKKYYQRAGIDEIILTGDENNFIEEQKESGNRLRLLFCPDACPLSYLDDNGQPAGILIDYSKKILDKAGLPYEFIRVRDRKQYEQYLYNNDFDIILDHYSNYNFSEEHEIRECEPYYTTSLCLLRKKSPDENISTLIEAAGHDFTGSDTITVDDIKTVEDIPSAAEVVDILLNNRDAGIIVPVEIADVLVLAEETNSLTYSVVSYKDCSIGMAVPNAGSPYLVSIMNKLSFSLSAREEAEIHDRYASYLYEDTSLVARLYDDPGIAFFALITFIIIIALIAIIIIIKRNYRTETRLNARLKEALEREKEANGSKDRFFASLSHDMRTPLNGILGMARVTEKEHEEPGSVEANMKNIVGSAEYLMLMIEDALAMSMGRLSELKLSPEPVYVDDVWYSTESIAAIYARERSVDIMLNRENIKNDCLIMDKRRVQQAVLNIISNAVKYSRPGSIVEISLEGMDSEPGRMNSKLVIRDHGIGMSEDFQKHMFDLYSQENRGDMTNYAGRGLGLPIARKLIEKMGGHINIESKLDVGTTVTIFFSFEKAPESERQEAENPDAVSLKGLHALVCEDNELNMSIICTILDTEGIIPVEAENGKIGVDKFSASDEGSFDIILMDIRMPEMDGLEAARAIRELDREDAKNIPIIAVSANAFEEDVKNSLEAGMNAHIAKPVNPEKLFGEIRKLI